MSTVIGRQPQVSNSIKTKLQSISIRKLYLFVVKRYYHFLKNTPLIKKADYCFYSGSELVLYPGNVCGKGTQYIRINTTDYQSFIKAQNTHEKDENIYDKIVFIDQYIPLHPDNMIRGESYDVEAYYAEMNEIFDCIEKKYNTKVVIAAHPASLEYKKRNYYNGREVYFGNTVDKVIDARYVITHHSTAVAYPVLANKPIIIVYTHQFDGKMIGQVCYSYQKKLNCYLITRDVVDSLPTALEVDKVSYDNYKYSFLTSKETEGVSNDMILLKVLRNDNDS